MTVVTVHQAKTNLSRCSRRLPMERKSSLHGVQSLCSSCACRRGSRGNASRALLKGQFRSAGVLSNPLHPKNFRMGIISCARSAGHPCIALGGSPMIGATALPKDNRGHEKTLFVSRLRLGKSHQVRLGMLPTGRALAADFSGYIERERFQLACDFCRARAPRRTSAGLASKPFDRMLIAQAQPKISRILSKELFSTPYGLRRIW